jgi:hypothetical protein
VEVVREDWELPVAQLRKGLMEGAKLGTFFPGFPTLQHIIHTARLKKAQVTFFWRATSKKDRYQKGIPKKFLCLVYINLY